MTTNEFIHRKDLGYQYIIDLASSDASYYYPVVFSYEPPLYAAETLKFHVIRPSVNQDGSSYGSMDLDVEIQRAVWDNTDYQYTYRFFEKSGPLSRWFGVVNHGYHGVVYLRGGRTYYLYSSAPVANISNLGTSYTIRSGETAYEITFGIQTDINTQPPTSVPSDGTESVIWVNAVPNKSLESNANIMVPGITLTSGAGANKILSSDASGNASWGYTAVGSVGSPGSSTNLVTEAGIRTAINDMTNLATQVHALTSKATPVDADEAFLIDSAASYGPKRLTWANLKATLKTYNDTLYAPIAKGVTNGDSHDHAGGDGAQISHSTLSNLTADNHTQYLNTTRHDTTGRHSLGTVIPIVKSSGSSTGTGSQQKIAHGLSVVPHIISIVPTASGTTVAGLYADSTNFYVTVTSDKKFNWCCVKFT